MDTFYKRQSLRLPHYDYSQMGLYFITICEHGSFKYFGEITNDIFIPNDAGKMINTQWLNLTKRFDTIQLHQHVVMPNHFHAIIEITQNSDIALGDIIGAFKSLTTNQYIKGVKENGWIRFDQKLWQRNYYEHVIRSEESYIQLSEYIRDNPIRWREDKFYL
jgi:REP element-mobilizing transposase RayT